MRPAPRGPRDVIVSPKYKTLAALPRGAKVGTSSLRRTVLLRRARPDLDIVPLRGNVDTRLAKVDRGEVDAILLARAGLVRLGLADRATEIVDPSVMLPAVGQGALGIETRADDAKTRALLAVVHHKESAVAVAAERGVMFALEADCKTPVASYAYLEGDDLVVRAVRSEPSGENPREESVRAPFPQDEQVARELGIELGRKLA